LLLERDIQSLRQNSYHHLLPHANATVQNCQAGFQSGKSTTDQLFAQRQILEKCNENAMNITTNHPFIDFKAAYDTIIRNGAYFHTKLIRFTKATLTIVTCCVKIQNDCTDRIKTGRRFIYAAFQCRAGSYRMTCKPTNNRHNLQQRNTNTRI
jgi:hypothetical protein